MDGQTFAGIIIAVLAAFCGNFGVNLQKLSFIYEQRKPPQDRTPYWKQYRWWIGMIFVVSASLGNFAALALAPQSVVAPIGAVSIVVNLAMANRFLGEPLSRIDFIGAFCICAGMAIAVVFSGTEDQEWTIDQINDLWLDFRTLAYVAAAVGTAAMYYTFKLMAERVLHAHIDMVGQLLLAEAAKIGLYSAVPGGKGVDPASAAAAGGDTTPATLPPVDSEASLSGAALLPTTAASPATTPGVEEGGGSAAPPGIPSVASEASLSDPTVLAAAAETVKREHGRSDDPAYAPPNMTAFIKGVDESAASALQAAGRRPKRSSTPTGEKGESSEEQEGGDDTFVDLDAVADIIGKPPAGYDWYASLHPLSYAGLAAVLGAQNTLFAKAVGEGLTATIAGDNQFTNPLIYVYLACLICSIVFQQHFLASGLQLFDALYIIPVFKAHFIVFGVLAGGLFYREFDQYDTTASIMFPIGLLIGIGGVLLLTARKGGSHAAPSHPESDATSPTKGGTTTPPSPLADASPTPPPLGHGATLPVGVDAFAAAAAGGSGSPLAGSQPHTLPRSSSAHAPRSTDLLDLPDASRPPGRHLPGGRGGEPVRSAARRGRTATEGDIGLGTRGEVEAAREAAAATFAQFVAQKAGAEGGAPVPGRVGRRGDTYLRANWVESILGRRATLDGVVSFAMPPGGEEEGGGAEASPGLPPSTAPRLPPAFSISMAGGGHPPLVRASSDGGAATAPAPTLHRAVTTSPRARRPRQSVLMKAVQGLQGLPAAIQGLPAAIQGLPTALGEGVDEERDDTADVLTFGFDSEAEVRPHVESRPPSPSSTTGGEGEGGGRKVNVVVDSVARGMASLSQLFIEDHATAAMTAGTYAGRAGSVSLGVPVREEVDDEFIIPPSAVPVVAPPALPAASAPSLPSAISEEEEGAGEEEGEQV